VVVVGRGEVVVPVVAAGDGDGRTDCPAGAGAGAFDGAFEGDFDGAFEGDFDGALDGAFTAAGAVAGARRLPVCHANATVSPEETCRLSTPRELNDQPLPWEE
jgi:hypothetical protein